jgi:hypothetical protein
MLFTGRVHWCDSTWTTTPHRRFSRNWVVTAAALLHAFGTLRPLKLVQQHMTSPGEFIAAYSDNVNGRGSHDHCIDAINTTQRVGPDYGIKPYISLGVKPSDILSHPDDDETPTYSRYAKYSV